MSWKAAGRAALRRVGFVVHRWPGNRFDAMEDALRLLHRGGFRPRVVVDCGANCGQWFGLASRVFTGAEFHLIEPQSYCWPELERAAASRGRTNLHRTVVTAPGRTVVGMARGGSVGSTGFAMLGSRVRDLRLRIGDAIFVRRDSPLAKDVSWD